ncbi:hypothetical protein LINGRAHAP2_LOCUS10146 [Linum grandiflorum]
MPPQSPPIHPLRPSLSPAADSHSYRRLLLLRRLHFPYLHSPCHFLSKTSHTTHLRSCILRSTHPLPPLLL